MMYQKNKIKEDAYNLNMLKENLNSLRGAINIFEGSVNRTTNEKLQEIQGQTTQLIEEVENLHIECDASVVLMDPDQRSMLKKELSAFIKFFGWSNRIKKDGTILYDD